MSNAKIKRLLRYSLAAYVIYGTVMVFTYGESDKTFNLFDGAAMCLGFFLIGFSIPVAIVLVVVAIARSIEWIFSSD
jgi:hypothetical protein